MSQSTTQIGSGLSRRAKIAIGILTAMTLLLCTVTLGLTLGRGVVADLPTTTPTTVASQPTGAPQTPAPGATATPQPDAPQIVTAPGSVTAGAAFAVFGSHWTAGDQVTVFLRDPNAPGDPILPLGSGQVSADGTFALTVSYPTEPRWARLSKGEVIVQSGATGAYYTTSIDLLPSTATLPPTTAPTQSPAATPAPATWTPRPSVPTATPTRVPPTSTPNVFTDWKGEYFTNANLSGSPVVVRNDADVNFNWVKGSPSQYIPVDYFSVRWTRQLWFPAAQTYRFIIRADDGVRLWIDNALILDEWHLASPNPHTRDVALSAGWHSFRLDYFEATGDAQIQFRIENAPVTITEWKGEYFANTALTGAPALTRNDAAISFDWGQGAPDGRLPVDKFSARWTRSLTLDGGTYRFTIRADDGVRFFVDGFLFINEWHDNDGAPYTVEVPLGTGAHTFVIEYYENEGKAAIWFTAQLLGDNTRWRGEYFANDRLSGQPTVIRQDERLDFNWANGSPHGLIPPDRFSVRWTRSIALDGGLYRFDIAVDDAVRFWVDNQLVLDQWRSTDSGAYAVTLSLLAGTHTFKIEYADFGGLARFSWTRTYLGAFTPTPTRTVTASPTATPIVPTVTSTPTPVPPTSTWTPTPTATRPPDEVPPTFTWTPTPTATERPATEPEPTWTPVRPTATWTPAPPTATWTPAPPTATRTPVPPTATSTVTPAPTWLGEYFDNPELKGKPVMTRRDARIRFDWADGAPGQEMPADQFSVRWTRTVTVEAGVYHFSVQADDGVRVYVDDKLIIDEWHSAQDTIYQAFAQLTGRPHTLKVEYFEDSKEASINLTIEAARNLPARRIGPVVTPTLRARWGR